MIVIWRLQLLLASVLPPIADVEDARIFVGSLHLFCRKAPDAVAMSASVIASARVIPVPEMRTIAWKAIIESLAQ